ncbi:MAG TPA: hypothetical protein VHY22_14305 [Chthoniobacteraceae bacterium]|nr:hypothetical protein [Chthoniobacteraceae bacterium]
MSEISTLIDKPYNKPDASNPKAKEEFLTEYEGIDFLVRSKLNEFGSVDAVGRAEFSMGNPWNTSRKIGITINTELLFSEALLKVLWTAVQDFRVDYLLVLSGEYGPRGGDFYICIQKSPEVLGYAPDKSMLKPFGFT